MTFLLGRGYQPITAFIEKVRERNLTIDLNLVNHDGKNALMVSATYRHPEYSQRMDALFKAIEDGTIEVNLNAIVSYDTPLPPALTHIKGYTALTCLGSFRSKDINV